jgi:hypothetical protein
MSVVGTPRTEGLVSRVMNILMRPRAEWGVIAAEPANVQGLFLGYAAILAAIPAVAQIVHGLLPFCLFGACWTPNPVFVVVGAVVYYIASLASVFVIGIIIDALAPSFGGQKSQEQAMKVAVYSWTAAWLAGVFVIVPWFGGLLSLVGLYSLYLLYTGLPALMKAPEGQSLGYTAVVVVLAIVVSVIVGAVVGSVSAIGALSGGLNNPGQLSGTVHVGNGSIDLNRLQQGVQQLQQQVQSAQSGASGSSNGSPGGAIVAVDPAKLKALLPDSVGGAPRTELTSTSAGGSALSNTEAVYSNGDVHVTITITDLGAASSLAAFAGALNVQSDKETATGYERVQTINGQLTTEKYDNQSKSGEYSVVVANRFNIDATGTGVPIDTLKGAVATVGPDRLVSLAHG